ncbi:LPXTG cell wall anchor domain-containing protein [Lentzea chajnantorensis]
MTITVDGKEQPAQPFRESFKQTWTFPADVKHDFKIKVAAHDDPNNKHGYSKTYDRSSTACVKYVPPTTTTTTTPPVTTTTTEAPSSSAEVPPSTTSAAPAPGGSTPEPPLAATGASPTWLLLSGLGLVGAGAAALLVVRRRRA